MAQLSKEAESKEMAMARNVAEKSGHSPAQAIERFTHDVGTKIGTVAHDISDKAEDYVATTRNYVKDHPLQSVAIAAATGLAVGSLLTMVSNRKH